ncbi:MAG TPA: glycosyltransferase, partial [Brevibacterium sp.]|nr:glycosyltransferase [Brevibacterium sp.]
MRAVVATYGTRGDVEPVAAVAVQLRAAEVDVRVCAPPDEEFVELLDRAGVPMVPFGKPWHSWAQGPSTAEERVLDADEFVAGHIAATYDVLAEAATGSDVMLATGMLHFVARSVAEKTGTPYRFVIFSPGLEDAPERDERIGAPINAHRASIGLAPVEDIRTHLFGQQPWVAADPALAPEQDSADPDGVRT